MESIIGLKYKPNDNSYSYCITDGHKYNAERHYLAGTDKLVSLDDDYETFVEDKPAQIVTIISEPFKVNVQCNVTKEKKTFREHEMIVVCDNNNYQHIVLFNKLKVIK